MLPEMRLRSPIFVPPTMLLLADNMTMPVLLAMALVPAALTPM